jgi:hypothetical protein
VNGSIEVVVAPCVRLFSVLNLTFVDGKIVRVELIADPSGRRDIGVEVLVAR